MTKLTNILAKDKSIDLEETEIEELLQTIREQRGYIYPGKISDLTGFELEKIEKFLLVLSVRSYLKHFIIPKYKGKILFEEAEEGFNFNSFHSVLNKEEGYFDEALNDDVILLSAYKKNA